MFIPMLLSMKRGLKAVAYIVNTANQLGFKSMKRGLKAVITPSSMSFLA